MVALVKELTRASYPVVSWAHSATRATMFAVSDRELAMSDFWFASSAAFHDMTPKTPNRMAVTAPKTSRNQTRIASGKLR